MFTEIKNSKGNKIIKKEITWGEYKYKKHNK